MTRRYIVLDFDELAKDVLNEVGDYLVKEGKKNMDKTSHGKFEYSYKVNRWRWVSRRGQSANNETGELRKTIRFKVNGHSMEYGAGNGSINYAKFLENRSWLNRPNVVKSVQDGKNEIERKIESKFIRYLRWNGD